VVLRVTHDGSCLRVELTGPAGSGSSLAEHAVPASLAVARLRPSLAHRR
jgi:hypothetical protein